MSRRARWSAVWRCCTALAGVAVLAVTAPAAWGSFSGVPVKAQPRPVDEYTPAVSADYFAWSQNSSAHTGTYNEYEQAMSSGVPTGAARRVNRLHTQAYGGGISNTRLAYQEIAGTASDIRFYNLALHQHSNPPPGVNTPYWEWDPQLTDTWLMFGRLIQGTTRVLLYNLQTHSVRVLISIANPSSGANAAVPGQVNGNYATFFTCENFGHSCTVYLYDIAARTLSHVTRPAGTIDTSPAVTSAGTLFFDRESAGTSCHDATLMEQPLAGSATAVQAFAAGVDINALQTYNDGTNDQLFYERSVCKPYNSDIYRGQLP
ncbi:MAG: hypothetical protein ACTHNU_03250 [Gaiellales bacterium]